VDHTNSACGLLAKVGQQAFDRIRGPTIIHNDLDPMGIALVDHTLHRSLEQNRAVLGAGDDAYRSIHV
jgi:hypothetical protein